jgi:hypothetical protein
MNCVIWTGWKNGRHGRTGVGYGFRLSREDRDQHFKREWQTVTIEVPHGGRFITIEASIDSQSFWEECCELRDKEIRQWMYRERHAPWPDREPPKFQVTAMGNGRFRVNRAI